MKSALIIGFTVCLLGLSGCIAQRLPQNISEREKIDLQTQLRERYWAFYENRTEIKHGPFTVTFGNGSNYIIGNYSLGELDGKYSVFSDKGEVVAIGWYVKGRRWVGSFLGGHQLLVYVDGKLIKKYTPEDQ